MMKEMKADFVVVGGGIAGVSALEMLSTCMKDHQTALLITASSMVKAVTNVSHITKTLATFDVTEKEAGEVEKLFPNIKVIQDSVTEILPEEKAVKTESGRTISYQKLALCHGARPKLIAENNPYVVGIRDTESVNKFREKLKHCSKICVIGNGGIATELVYELENVQIVWVIKDKSVASTFVDAGAGEFLLDSLKKGRNLERNSREESSEEKKVIKRMKFTVEEAKEEESSSSKIGGSALGPDWHRSLGLSGGAEASKNVEIEYEAEVKRILERKSPDDKNVSVELTNGKIIDCDLVISATGVTPNGDLISPEKLRLSPESGAIYVDGSMRTNLENVYAAGDVCEVENWESAESGDWLQMRLWTQARQMGLFAAQCMAASLNENGRNLDTDFCFELFGHMTKFFGFKVVLLGLFNGQRLSDYEALLRVTPGEEYVKTVMKDGRMRGAVLIGETDLEETFENLILNRMDLTDFGESILDPDVDIGDFFD